MAELKTQPSDKSVVQFLNTISDAQKRQDSFTLLKLMRKATGEDAKMWGDSIVGFGNYRYKYASGREGEWFLVGFSPRKANLTLYIMSGFEKYDDLLKSLGKYTTGKSCLYIKRLEDIHMPTLNELVLRSAAHMKKANT